MEGEAILQTTAEVSVALAGFTGVVAAFGQRRGNWSALDTIRFRVMLGTSLTALVFSILPIAVHHIGVDPAAMWAISSVLLASHVLIMITVYTRRFLQVGAVVRTESRVSVFFLAYSLVAVAAVSLVLNALGIGFHRSFGPYFLGVCCLLLICALMFTRLLSFVGQQIAEE